jgi:hypothetical protein
MVRGYEYMWEEFYGYPFLRAKDMHPETRVVTLSSLEGLLIGREAMCEMMRAIVSENEKDRQEARKRILIFLGKTAGGGGL